MIARADAAGLDLVADALGGGGVVVVPTDTVYGLVALPGDDAALARIHELKGRPASQPLAVLVADAEQAERLVEVSPRWRDLASAHWPGALTIVAERARSVTWELGGDAASIGVRAPDHDFIRRLCRRVGPVAATSANRHGGSDPRTLDEVLEAGIEADVLVDGGTTAGIASTVVDVRVSPPEVLRQGSVDVGPTVRPRPERPGPRH